MILFKPRLDVTIDNITVDKKGSYILTKALFEKTKIIFLNVYAPNDQTHQVHFLRDLFYTIMNQHANEHVVLGGDFNCALNNTLFF